MGGRAMNTDRRLLSGDPGKKARIDEANEDTEGHRALRANLTEAESTDEDTEGHRLRRD